MKKNKEKFLRQVLFEEDPGMGLIGLGNSGKGNLSSVVIQKLLYTDRHSGLDPESSLFNWIPAFVGMTNLVIIVKKCWIHYTSSHDKYLARYAKKKKR